MDKQAILTTNHDFRMQENDGFEFLADLSPDKGAILTRMFRHTRMSYKYFWFLALIDLVLEGNSKSIAVNEVLHQMAVRAWHPVCFFRLSFGVGDGLEEKVRVIQSASDLANDSPRGAILSYLSSSTWATDQLGCCVQYVPTRLLQTHFTNQLARRPDQQKDALTRKLAVDSQKTRSPSIYWLRTTNDGDFVEMNSEWFDFLNVHSGIIRAFAEYGLCQFLQSKNPNIPGIVNKLHAPTSRKLIAARKFWVDVRDTFKRSGRPAWFVDIYTSKPLVESFGIDHFLPWSFVAHDLPWNLTPVSQATNSLKSDRLPRLETHLPLLASLHHRALRMNSLHNRRITIERLTPYAEIFNMDSESVLKLTEAEFTEKYRLVMEPQERIARYQGFRIFV